MRHRSPLARTHALAAGPPVRLRLARPADADGLHALLDGRGIAATPLELRRLLSFDPLRRAVLCATAPLDGTDVLVGLGAIDLTESADVDTLVVDERLTDGLGELLTDVLRERAASHARRVA